jgi:signal transduction histidine kinase
MEERMNGHEGGGREAPRGRTLFEGSGSPAASRIFGTSPDAWARQWRRVIVVKVVGILLGSVLALLLVNDAGSRSLFVLLAAGVYLPVSLLLYAVQRRNPVPPTAAWFGITLADIAIVSAAQALFPRLGVAFIGLTAIVMVCAVLIGARWAMIMAGISWAGLLAATLFGGPGQVSAYSAMVAGILLVGMAFLIGTLAEDERRAADRSRQLAKAIASVGSSVELSDVLESLCGAARDVLDGRFAVVLMVEGDRLVFGPGSGQSDELRGTDDMLSQLLTDPANSEAPTVRALKSMQPVAVADSEDDEAMAPWRETARAMRFRSMIAVPIQRGDVAVGVLNVYLARPHRFTEEETEFLSALAEHAGIAIERARMYESERRATERLRELDRLKSEFVATVSHELRTPLTAIVGFALTLRDRWPEFPPELRREFLERLGDNARTLEHLITHLLDFGRLERGEFEIQPFDHDLSELIPRIVGNLVHELSEHRVVTDVEPGLRLRVDRYAFERILGNLLSNAGKFSARGTTVEVKARRDGPQVAVSVRDQGPGIPEEAMTHIFELFYRGSAATRGTGIGLAVVKDLVDLHEGSVEVRNCGPGAEFTVRLAASASRTEEEDAGGDGEAPAMSATAEPEEVTPAG